MNSSKTVIVGNGVAGVTAARHIRKLSDSEITIISGESEYFFSRTALMYIYMGHMNFEHTKPYEDGFWKKNKIELVHAWVDQLDVNHKKIILDSGEEIVYESLILATGSVPNKFGWEGQDLEGVSTLYSLQDLEKVETYTQGIKSAVVVGGGLIGVELVEMLLSRGIEVTFLVREKSFWDIILPSEESSLINKEINKHGVNLLLGTELDGIFSDEEGKVKSIKTKNGQEIECQFVGLTVGVSPNKVLAEKSGIPVQKGILVDDFLQTEVEGVYAIGDCTQIKDPLPHRRAIEAVWYTGRMMGETVARTITGKQTKYQPGIWFNSAKFFNIEYQTYGQVDAHLSKEHESVVWQELDKAKLVRIVFDKESKAVVGVNTLGIRMRHEVWDHWISSGYTIDQVMKELPKANFDPEFFKRYEKEVVSTYRKQLISE